MNTTKTIEQLEDELRGIESVIERERRAEQTTYTRRTAFSRLPGLYSEREQLKAAIALAREPQDAALALAKDIINLRTHDTIVLARFLRERMPELAGGAA